MPRSGNRGSDSRSSLFTSLQVEVDGAMVPIPTMHYLTGIEASVSETTGGSVEVSLFDPNHDELEDLIIGMRRGATDTNAAKVASTNAPETRRLLLQFGWDKGGANVDLPRWEAVFSGYEPDYEDVGTTIKLSGTAKDVVRAATNRKPRWFRAGLRADEVVRAIADDNGWLNPVIERTRDPLKELSAGNLSDVRFLRDSVLKSAVSEATGQPILLYWDYDGRCHFHSSGYATLVGGTTQPLDADYLQRVDPHGDVIRFSPRDNTLAAAVLGAGNTAFTGSDNAAGHQLSDTADGTRLPTGAGAMVYGDGLYRPVPSTISSRLHIPGADAVDFQQRVAHRWGSIARLSYTAQLEVRGTHAMRVGGLVRVTRQRRDGTTHHLSGVFTVTKVSHSVAETWTTTAELVRIGAGYGATIVGATAVPSVNPPAAVAAPDPGQRPQDAGPRETFTEALAT